jgi:cytochrome P450
MAIRPMVSTQLAHRIASRLALSRMTPVTASVTSICFPAIILVDVAVALARTPAVPAKIPVASLFTDGSPIDHQNYSKDNTNYRMLKPVLGEGLLTSDGEHWLRQRRLIQPVFRRQRIASFASLTTTATRELLEDWDALAPSGQPVDVAADMMRLTLRVVGETLFSIDISNATDRVGRAFMRLNEDVAYRFRTILVPPLLVPTPRNRAFKRARAELDRVVYKIITGRRQGDGSTDDVVDVLVAARDEASGTGMTNRQLRDEVMTLLLGGHETTATALSWTWYLLSKHPGVARKLRAELDHVLGGRVPNLPPG